MSLHSTLIKIIDSFLPTKLRIDINPRPEIIIQARAMVGILMLSMVTPMVLLPVFVILHFTTNDDFSLLIMVYGGLFATQAVQQLYFYSFGNLRLTASVFSATFFLSIVGSIYISGGWHSPVMLLLYAAPMLSFLGAGTRAGLFTILGSFIVGLAFLAIELNGIPLPKIMNESIIDYIIGLVWISAFGVLLALFLTYDALLKALEKQPPTNV